MSGATPSGPSGARSAYYGKDLEAMSFARNYHRWILDRFAPYIGSTVAEVGAGTGDFSELLLGAGIDRLVAFEPSTNMYPLLERRLAGSHKVETINARFGERADGYRNAFDAVAYINVLEHIEKDAEELFQVATTLRRGGHLLVFVPALPFLTSQLDRDFGHFRRYRRRELVDRVRSAGLEVRKADYFDLAGVLPWYIAFVLLQRPFTPGSVALYDRLVVPVARRVEAVFPPPLGKNLLLVAQKL